MGLPFAVNFGKIKHLSVQIPWTSILKKSIVLNLETLMLVVSPLDSSQWKTKDALSLD